MHHGKSRSSQDHSVYTLAAAKPPRQHLKAPPLDARRVQYRAIHRNICRQQAQ